MLSSLLLTLILAGSARANSFNHAAFKEEFWPANVANIQSGQTLLRNQPPDYKAAAVLYSDGLFQGTNPSDANWPVWALFTASAKNGPGFNSQGLALYNAARASAPTLPKGGFAPFFLDTPIPRTRSGHHLLRFSGYNPQVVPEPGTLMLVGTGIIGLAGIIRKKLARS